MRCPKLSNPIDPTPADLRLWAYTPDACYPDEMSQDWDLCVTSFKNAGSILQFASDVACPNRDFFLRCLYLLAGDCVRTEGGREDIPKLRAFLLRVPLDADRLVRLWVDRTQHLLAHPESFDYELWCCGDFARNESAA